MFFDNLFIWEKCLTLNMVCVGTYDNRHKQALREKAFTQVKNSDATVWRLWHRHVLN